MARTILITGAGKRLGRAFALSLARAGWNVAVHYHRSEKEAKETAAEIESLSRKAYLVQADLNDTDAVSGIFPALAKQGARIDALINSAAAFEKDTLATLTQESWREHMQVNLLAPLLLMRDFARHYKGAEGCIINITDGLQGWSMSPAFLSYALSKESLTHATRMLARELAPAIRINAIAPGATLEGKQDKEDTFAKLAGIIPLKRTGSIEEVARALHFLLESPSVTGQVLMLSGGMDCA